MSHEQDDAAMRHYYQARAAEYDRIYAKPERQADLAGLRGWLLPWFQGRRVLELACGTGHWTAWLATVAQRITAVDTAPATLAVARARLSNQPGAGTVQWQVADAYALPAGLPVCDAGFAGFWFSHVPRARWQGFLAGWAAQLEPGAVVVMIDNRFVPGSSTPLAETDAAGDSWQWRALDDGSRHRVLKNFPDEHQMRAAIAPHGRLLAWETWRHYWGVAWEVAPGGQGQADHGG